jgi:hypothetical protein
MRLLASVDDVLLPRGLRDAPAAEPDAATLDRWRRRYQAGLRRLRQAGLRTIADESPRPSVPTSPTPACTPPGKPHAAETPSGWMRPALKRRLFTLSVAAVLVCTSIWTVA